MDFSAAAVSLGLALFVGLLISAPSISSLIRMRRRSTHWISALPPAGTVMVTGKVRETNFRAPMTKMPCAVYKLEIQEFYKDRRGGGWMTINDKASSEPFEIEDGTGTVQVHPFGAELNISHKNFVEELDAEQNAALDSLGIATSGFFGANRTLRVTEYLISPGQEIFVQGVVQQKDGVKLISSAGGGDLFISDQGEAAVLIGLIARIRKIFFYAFIAAVVLFFMISLKNEG